MKEESKTINSISGDLAIQDMEFDKIKYDDMSDTNIKLLRDKLARAKTTTEDGGVQIPVREGDWILTDENGHSFVVRKHVLEDYYTKLEMKEGEKPLKKVCPFSAPTDRVSVEGQIDAVFKLKEPVYYGRKITKDEIIVKPYKADNIVAKTNLNEIIIYDDYAEYTIENGIGMLHINNNPKGRKFETCK